MAEDITGKKFVHVTAIRFSHKVSTRTSRDYYWVCQCDCGKIFTPTRRNLVAGNTKSCGCLYGIQLSDPITQEQLKKLLRYNPDTGLFTWLVSGKINRVGDIAGHTNDANRYVRICIRQRSYLAHILAYFYMLGVWPEYEMDHKNTNPRDNRWINLRPATRQQNAGNLSRHKRNKSGYKGVMALGKKYKASIRGQHIGTFETAQEAAHAYDRAALSRFGVFARINFEGVE